MRLVSVLVPIYNEEECLPHLYERLVAVAASSREWAMEFIFIDDASGDSSPRILRELAESDPRVRVIRLARNSGSHIACVAGVRYASGDAAVIIAADLQDPPELIPRLVEKWLEGHQVVWAVRGDRKDSIAKVWLAKLYHALTRLIALPNAPPDGVDCCLFDRKLMDIIRQAREKNTSIFGLLLWAGFKQGSVTYVKEHRESGASKWSFPKKVKLAIDTIVSFSYVPIRLMSALGVIVSFVGFGYAAFILISRLLGRTTQVEGWASLMVVILVLAGLQIGMLGVLGEYLWRALDQGRRRPLFVVDETFGFPRGIGSMRDQTPPVGAGHGIPPNPYNPHAWIINDPLIGEDCWIGAFTVIDGIGGLRIGKGCNISCGAHIITHSTVERCVSEGAHPIIDKKETVIGDYVFIGENATILQGVTIGDHSVIGAGTVLVEDTVIPPHSLVVGVPGRIIRSLERGHPDAVRADAESTNTP